MRSNQLSYAPRQNWWQSTMRPGGGQVSLVARSCGAAALLALLLCACQMRDAVLSLDPLPPTTTAVAPTATVPSQNGWQELAPGLESHRSLATGSLFGQAFALRVDPRLFKFRAHYEPGEARTLDDWLDALPGVTAFINANFFDRDSRINGLLVADGHSHGQPWLTRGGTFLLREGLPVLQPNRERPWGSGVLRQAVQGFPMLVLAGQPAYRRSGPPARRSVVALDRQGRVLLFATPLLGPSLAEMAAWLASPDLEIDSALNLDGGGSTMFYVDAAEPLRLPSLDPVPALLAVWPP
ncbi:MAG: phosphodiester glycosidase family protein [Anaerolineaceae bacterium]|nr:phosphodiester glycosidase family protein [Anaerolineaceae bacterium]